MIWICWLVLPDVSIDVPIISEPEQVVVNWHELTFWIDNNSIGKWPVATFGVGDGSITSFLINLPDTVVKKFCPPFASVAPAPELITKSKLWFTVANRLTWLFEFVCNLDSTKSASNW